MTHRLTRDQARRIVVRAQLLDADRPGDVVEVAEQLGYIKIDPTSAIAPCEHTVLWWWISWSYESGQLKKAVEVDRLLFELRGAFHPMRMLPLFRPAMRRHPERESSRHWLEVNAAFRADALSRLRAEGPLTSRDIPDTAAVAQRPDGRSGSKQVPLMLDLLARRGEVAVTRREGHTRAWDLADRVYPADPPEVDDGTAAHELQTRGLKAAGIARERSGWTRVGKAGVAALLRPPSADGRPFRRDGGRRGRSRQRAAACQRGPRVRGIRLRGDRYGARRDRGPRRVARGARLRAGAGVDPGGQLATRLCVDGTHPSSGATNLANDSTSRRLNATPSWLGIVSISVSALVTAASSRSCSTSTSGAAA